jgi:hypothetical protein
MAKLLVVALMIRMRDMSSNNTCHKNEIFSPKSL